MKGRGKTRRAGRRRGAEAGEAERRGRHFQLEESATQYLVGAKKGKSPNKRGAVRACACIHGRVRVAEAYACACLRARARVHACARECVGAWVRGCLGACVRACVCACARACALNKQSMYDLFAIICGRVC
eukprot:175827-Pleurochrysis_carterae.AAC.2